MTITTVDGTFYVFLYKPGVLSVRSKEERDLCKCCKILGIDYKQIKDIEGEFPYEIQLKKEIWKNYLNNVVERIEPLFSTLFTEK